MREVEGPLPRAARMFYLSIPPNIFTAVAASASGAASSKCGAAGRWSSALRGAGEVQAVGGGRSAAARSGGRRAACHSLARFAVASLPGW